MSLEPRKGPGHSVQPLLRAELLYCLLQWDRFKQDEPSGASTGTRGAQHCTLRTEFSSGQAPPSGALRGGNGGGTGREHCTGSPTASPPGLAAQAKPWGGLLGCSWHSLCCCFLSEWAPCCSLAAPWVRLSSFMELFHRRLTGLVTRNLRNKPSPLIVIFTL